MVDIERRCMSIILLSIGLFALVSCQMFDRKPTVYDHMKSGANTVKTNLVESELKIETEFLPNRCTPVDEDDFFDDPDKQREIFIKKEQLRMISAEDGDTVTMEFKIFLDADGTEIDSSTKPPEEEGQDNVIIPAIFTLGKGMIIPGWEIGAKGMCLGEIRRLIVPSQLAYGPKGYKKMDIPPDATLEIEVKLVELKKKNWIDHYMDFIQSIHIYAFFILGLTFLLSGYYKSKIAEKRRLYRELEELENEKEKED